LVRRQDGLPRRDRRSSHLARRPGGRKNSQKRVLSRCGAPPWPRIAAALLTVAWYLPHLELPRIPLASRHCLQRHLPTPSPLATTAVQRKKEGPLQPDRSTSLLPSRLRAPRAAASSLPVTMAGWRRQSSTDSLQQCGSCYTPPSPLASTVGQRGGRSRTSPHLQEYTNSGFIWRHGGHLLRLQVQPEELEQSKNKP